MTNADEVASWVMRSLPDRVQARGHCVARQLTLIVPLFTKASSQRCLSAEGNPAMD